MRFKMKILQYLEISFGIEILMTYNMQVYDNDYRITFESAKYQFQ